MASTFRRHLDVEQIIEIGKFFECSAGDGYKRSESAAAVSFLGDERKRALPISSMESWEFSLFLSVVHLFTFTLRKLDQLFLWRLIDVGALS